MPAGIGSTAGGCRERVEMGTGRREPNQRRGRRRRGHFAEIRRMRRHISAGLSLEQRITGTPRDPIAVTRMRMGMRTGAHGRRL